VSGAVIESAGADGRMANFVMSMNSRSASDHFDNGTAAVSFSALPKKQRVGAR
jgi:hypothetical protein